MINASECPKEDNLVGATFSSRAFSREISAILSSNSLRVAGSMSGSRSGGSPSDFARSAESVRSLA